ncbi:MAG: hypothetical protein WCA19_12460 [Candidatus Acidiferrales bacterium]
MLRRFGYALLIATAFSGLLTAQSQKQNVPLKAKRPETAHLAFVTEFIRELAAIEDIRETSTHELKDAAPGDILLNSIHSSTLFQLELQSQVGMLKGMRLNPPFDQLIPSITKLYGDEIGEWKKLSDISSGLLVGPKPGIDYGKLAAEMPQIRARLDYMDKILLEAVPVIFSTLIDTRADSKGHASHLVITREERAQVLESLNTDFGAKIDESNQDFRVTAAQVLRAGMLKDFKCSDDPWD